MCKDSTYVIQNPLVPKLIRPSQIIGQRSSLDRAIHRANAQIGRIRKALIDLPYLIVVPDTYKAIKTPCCKRTPPNHTAQMSWPAGPVT